jgi:glutathione synthase
VVKKGQNDNLNQIIENLRSDGYIVVQEYVPEAADGDIRLFVMNGDPLQVGGKYAAVRRTNASGDPRSNMHVGGKAKRVDIGEDVLRLAARIRPHLVENGLFLVGLDIVGDKLLEVNVFSPGGLYSCCELQGVDFTAPIIRALEEKVEFRAAYGSRLHNRVIAAL